MWNNLVDTVTHHPGLATTGIMAGIILLFYIGAALNRMVESLMRLFKRNK